MLVSPYSKLEAKVKYGGEILPYQVSQYLYDVCLNSRLYPPTTTLVSINSPVSQAARGSLKVPSPGAASNPYWSYIS